MTATTEPARIDGRARCADGRAVILLRTTVLWLACAAAIGWAGTASAAPAAAWRASARLARPHYTEFSAALLHDGRVLIAGGYGTGGVPSADVDIYDPASEHWSQAAPMPEKVAGESLTALPNGEVLVVGGETRPGATASAALFDPTARDAASGQRGTWILTGALHKARAFHTATLLPNGRVLVTGGCNTGCGGHTLAADDPTSSAELFDPAAVDPASGRRGTWTLLPPMQHGRFLHTATLLPGNAVLVVGGESASRAEPVAPPEILDLSAPDRATGGQGTWRPAGDEFGGVRRMAHTATLLATGDVLVVGGLSGPHGSTLASSELFSPRSRNWRSTGILAGGRSYHTATRLPDGRVLVAGGYNGQTAGTSAAAPIASAELYDPDTERWTSVSRMPDARAEHVAVLLQGTGCGNDCGDVLLAGGQSCTICGGNAGDGMLTDLYTASHLRPSDQSIMARDGRQIVAGGAGVAVVAVAGITVLLVRRRNSPW